MKLDDLYHLTVIHFWYELWDQKYSEVLNSNFELKKNFMDRFYGWGSTVSRLQRHYEDTAYFLQLRPRRSWYLID